VSDLRVWLPREPPPGALDGLPLALTLYDGETPPGEADVLVALGIRLPWLERLLPRMRGLRLLQTFSAGVDWLTGLVPEGAVLCDAEGVHDTAVAEWCMAAILAQVRRLPESLAAQASARWVRTQPVELEGARVCILGYGSIGEALEARLQPFGVSIVRVARRARDRVHPVVDLPALLPEATILVLLVPLTPQTRSLVGARELALLADGALVVNAARGPVLDTDALLAELQAGRLRASLDVTDPEPLPDGHPLWSAPGVLITAHNGGDTPGFPPKAWALLRRQLERLLAGEPLANVVSGGY
jgi:phosphoglycerate dehydrogenase-like enzyme